VRLQIGTQKTGDPFVVLIASGVKSQLPTPNSQIPNSKSQSPRSKARGATP
jgi:hypothetical protein